MFNVALKLCAKSGHHQHHHAAIVVSGGAIVAMGYNHGDTHAEVHALSKLWPNKRKNVKVYSMRFRKNGTWAMAKPCKNCENFLRDNGVKTVYYTDEAGLMVKMKL